VVFITFSDNYAIIISKENIYACLGIFIVMTDITFYEISKISCMDGVEVRSALLSDTSIRHIVYHVKSFRNRDICIMNSPLDECIFL